MALNKEYDGDITKVPGYYLAVARNKDTGDYIGFYALTQEGTFLRGAGTWITAEGSNLSKINGAQLIHMKDTYILRHDSLEKKNLLPPSDAVLEEKSTVGDSGSWGSQQDK